jgi:dolichol-phosphate mannosyltransferase
MVYVSLVLGVLAVLAIPIIAILRLILGYEFLGGQVTTIVLLLLIGAFQLFFLFILGQYVARIYDEARGRPLYVVATTTGFNETHMKETPTAEEIANPGM